MTASSTVWPKNCPRPNADHTQLGNFTVCVLAIQTGRGRAVPFWFQINQGRTNAAIRPLLAGLEELAAQLVANPRLQPVLVADRWFGSQKLMDFCQTAGWGFLFRTKTDKIVDSHEGKMPIDQICQYDSRVDYRGQDLRLILSKLRLGMDQPWWLLTNLTTSRQRLLQRYAGRWEIESTHPGYEVYPGVAGLAAAPSRLAPQPAAVCGFDLGHPGSLGRRYPGRPPQEAPELVPLSVRGGRQGLVRAETQPGPDLGEAAGPGWSWPPFYPGRDGPACLGGAV